MTTEYKIQRWCGSSRKWETVDRAGTLPEAKDSLRTLLEGAKTWDYDYRIIRVAFEVAVESPRHVALWYGSSREATA